MLIDGSARLGPVPESDVVVVGSGPASLALVDRLHRRGRSVLLVESGGLDLAAWSTALNAGEDSTGLDFGFHTGRRRVVGGNDGLWWGQCVRLEPNDFEHRPWVPHSGWPFGIEELEPWYDEAERWFGIAGAPDLVRHARGRTGRTVFDGTGDFRRRTTVFSRAHRHSADLVRACAGSPSVHLLHSATVTGVEVDGDRVRGLQAVTRSGAELVVRGRHVVLAAGGIENPRLLLSWARSNPVVDPRGQAGRYLQEHPALFAGRVVSPDTEPLQRQFVLQYRHRHRFWPKLALAAETQEREGALGATVALITRFAPGSGVDALRRMMAEVRHGSDRSQALGHLPTLVRGLPSIARQVPQRLAGIAPTSGRDADLFVQLQFEEAPDPHQRIDLSERLDDHGVPLPRLHWQAGAQVEHTHDVVVRALRDHLRRRGAGDVVADLGERLGDEPPRSWAHHHAGTTRMSDSPLRGVVDAHCRVHTLRNVHVAGSSVFPTSGWANPTLTIVALAFRLAERLHTVLDRH